MMALTSTVVYAVPDTPKKIVLEGKVRGILPFKERYYSVFK